MLLDLADPFAKGLVFKIGMSLSKVHAEFFRLSEDLEWIREASSTALIDERNCLLIVGWEDQELGTRAYTKYLEEGGEFVGDFWRMTRKYVA